MISKEAKNKMICNKINKHNVLQPMFKSLLEETNKELQKLVDESEILTAVFIASQGSSYEDRVFTKIVFQDKVSIEKFNEILSDHDACEFYEDMEKAIEIEDLDYHNYKRILDLPASFSNDDGFDERFPNELQEITLVLKLAQTIQWLDSFTECKIFYKKNIAYTSFLSNY